MSSRARPPKPPTAIPLPWTRPPLRANDRRGWQAQHRAFQQALTEARWAIRSTKPKPMTTAEVTLHWRVANNRVQDTDNIASTLKPCLDALVQEHILPSDDWGCVPVTGQRIHPPARGLPSCMWLELRPVSDYKEDDDAA